jgi:hypothetical protein
MVHSHTWMSTTHMWWSALNNGEIELWKFLVVKLNEREYVELYRYFHLEISVVGVVEKL